MEVIEYYGEPGVFEDREDAGRRLAPLLERFRNRDPLVLALPRGGVEVGYYVAQELSAPMDVVIARKLGAPGQEELGIGAIAPGGVRVVDQQAVRYLGVTDAQLDRITARETDEMERRLQLYRGNRPPPTIRGRVVILVDDGLATGVTARAAIQSILLQEPRELILAVPVCAGDTAESLRLEGIEVVCAKTPPSFRAVGYWYRDFRQVTDQEVIDFLERAEEKRGNDAMKIQESPIERPIRIDAEGTLLDGDLVVPQHAQGVVLFAHGSGSSRMSRRNRYVAQELQRAGMATLLMDLLSAEEEDIDARTGHLRFDIPFLGRRLETAIDWLRQEPSTRALSLGCFGASTGAAAALVAAAKRPDCVNAVVSRGGRPDMAEEALPDVQAPTLLIVGGADGPVIEMNRLALDRLHVRDKDLVIIPGATHLFPEPGALEEVARLAAEWFARHLHA